MARRVEIDYRFRHPELEFRSRAGNPSRAGYPLTIQTARRVLFAVLLVTLPLPLLALAPTLAPTLRYWLFALVITALVLVEGAAGVVPLLLALMWAHALVYAIACWLGAWALARALARLDAGPRGLVVTVAVAVALGGALLFPIYRTPLGSAPTTNLIGALS